MFTHNLAYRYSNGEIEGFTGISLSGKAEARTDAISKVIRKIGHIQVSRSEPNYDQTRLIEDNAGINADELKQMQSDWKISARSSTE